MQLTEQTKQTGLSQSNNTPIAQKTQQKTWADVGIQVFLAASFLLTAIFYTFSAYNGSFLFESANSAMSNFWIYAVFLSLVFWLIFELVMRLYFFFVSTSIYVFTVPKKESYNLFRLLYAIRNIVVGTFYLLVFKFPLILNFLSVIGLVFNFAFLFAFFAVIKQKYLDALLAPFALKAFLRPFLIYQLILSVFSIGGLLL